MPKFWSKLSRKERRLAKITGLLAIAFVVYAAVLPAVAHLRSLDAQIDDLEQAVVLATRQAALSYSVETRYAALATQHSTDWTEAEIYDGLQRELDRLALLDPNKPGNADNRIIRIATRPPGRLTAFDGYREYQASFQTQPANIEGLMEFVRRLQESPQALRIDRLELKRDPSTRVITADITVTRTVVDQAATAEGAPAAPTHPAENLARNASFEEWDTRRNAFPEWDTQGVRLSPVSEFATQGPTALQAVAALPTAAVFQLHRLPAGARYRASLDVAARGNATIGVKTIASGTTQDAKVIPPDGKPYHVDLGTFTVPGKTGETVDFAVPQITLTGVGSILYADNFVLEKVD